jgi:hypothetical protein
VVIQGISCLILVSIMALGLQTDQVIKLSFLLHIALINVPFDAFLNEILRSMFSLVTLTPTFATNLLRNSDTDTYLK